MYFSHFNETDVASCCTFFLLGASDVKKAAKDRIKELIKEVKDMSQRAADATCNVTRKKESIV